MPEIMAKCFFTLKQVLELLYELQILSAFSLDAWNTWNIELQKTFYLRKLLSGCLDASLPPPRCCVRLI